jgi:nitrogen fixation NifU-like protein
MHSPQIIDHFRNPRHPGVLPPPAVVVDAENPACGDRLRLSVLVEEGTVRQAAFQVKGCTASIAAGSALAEWLTGRAIAELAAFHARVIDAALGGLPPESKHAAMLAADAVRALSERVTSPASRIPTDPARS